MFLGFQVGRSGVESTLLTHVVLVAAEIALVATYPPYRGRPRARDAEGPRPQSALALLRSNPSFTLMLAGVLLSLTAVLPLSNFLVNIVTSRGGTDADLGLAMFVMGAFELPTAFLSQSCSAGSAAGGCCSSALCSAPSRPWRCCVPSTTPASCWPAGPWIWATQTGCSSSPFPNRGNGA